MTKPAAKAEPLLSWKHLIFRGFYPFFCHCWYQMCLDSFSVALALIWHHIVKHVSYTYVCSDFGGFLLTVVLLDSRGSLWEVGVSSTTHPGALCSAGDAEEIPPEGVRAAELRAGRRLSPHIYIFSGSCKTGHQGHDSLFFSASLPCVFTIPPFLNENFTEKYQRFSGLSITCLD